MVEEKATPEQILEELKRLQISMNFSGEYRYYILICGLFNNDRSIVKNWSSYEKTFLSLIEADGKIGIKQLLQAIIIFFMVKYPDQQKYAATFMTLLYEEEIFSDDFLIKWYNRKLKLDRNCALNDRKSEKKFKELLEKFIEWL